MVEADNPLLPRAPNTFEIGPQEEENMMDTSAARIGDKVRTWGASDVVNGVWEVVEVLPKPEGRKSNGGYVSRLRVMGFRRQTPDWPMAPWWVEDIAIMEIFKGPQLVDAA